MSSPPRVLQYRQQQLSRSRIETEGDRIELARLRGIIAQQARLILQQTEELERLRTSGALA